MTELGEIPIDWECSKLENYVEIRSGNSPSGFRLKEKGKYPFFKVDDMNYTSKYMKIAKVYFDEYKYELMSKGMVVFPKRGASIFTNKVAILDADGYFDTNTMGLACDSKLNNEYLYYQLKFIGLEKFADTTAVPQINNKHINPLVIPIPTIEEQEKIVSILSAVDEQIDNFDELIEKNKELKKGLMQQLLTKGIGHTKFKNTEIGEIPKGWEVKKLGEVFRLSSGNFLSQKNIVEGSYPVYGGNGITGYHNEFLFNDAKLVIGRVGAKCGCVCISEPNAWITDNALYISQKIEIFNDKYMYYLLDNINLNSYANQNAQPVISGQKIYSIDIGFPNIKEQEKIASILSEVDEKIQEYEDKKKKLEELKRGLMQQLLTGKIRVI